MLTSYDFTTAGIVDAAGIDGILIGDSASNVMAGNHTTLPMTVDQMIYHARSVVRAVKRALVVCDMPFGSYQVDCKEGVKNAVRIMKESGCDALKLEGGVEIIDTVKGILDAGIPVMGHLGLTPQSINKFGTYAVRAKEEAEAEKLLSDSILLSETGCFAVVLEKVPAKLAAEVTKAIKAPTIGIGAGGFTDGQILVIDDMLGKTQGFSPRFLRRYAGSKPLTSLPRSLHLPGSSVCMIFWYIVTSSKRIAFFAIIYCSTQLYLMPSITNSLGYQLLNSSFIW